jgi:hypothetical protein
VVRSDEKPLLPDEIVEEETMIPTIMVYRLSNLAANSHYEVRINYSAFV